MQNRKFRAEKSLWKSFGGDETVEVGRRPSAVGADGEVDHSAVMPMEVSTDVTCEIAVLKTDEMPVVVEPCTDWATEKTLATSSCEL